MNPIPRNPSYERAFRVMRLRQVGRKWLRRTGCLLMILVWLVCMLMPCFFVTLFVRKEIVISRGGAPGHQYRVFILEEPRQRGLGLERGSVASGGEDEDAVCVLTKIDYLLWKGKGEPVDYCNCYEKVGKEWSSTLVGGDAKCQPITPESEADQEPLTKP